MAVIGIDPGGSGGIAIIDEFGASSWKVPATERDTWDLLHGLYSESPSAVAYIEQVHSMPGQGVSSTFRFGASYGGLRMAMIAAGVPFHDVAPGVWQKVFRLPTLKKAGSNTAKKNAHKARAQELFPDLKITHATADALLIAEFGRRLTHNGVAT